MTKPLTTLAYEVFVADPIPQNVSELVPNGDRRMFSPLSITLIYGAHDAVLVDPPLTIAQGNAVGDWAASKGKRVTHVFVTHGHGDHWFTADMLAARFESDVLASPGTIRQMQRNVLLRDVLWDKTFPGQIPSTPITAKTPIGHRFQLEGHDLIIVDVGHTDTDESTVLHVPDLELVVAGDAIYNGVHQYLSESANGGRDAWRKAIDMVEALQPRWIVAGHKNKELDDEATRAIAETRSYLDDADALLQRHANPLDFFNGMLERYPNRLNPGALWSGAKTLYGAPR